MPIAAFIASPVVASISSVNPASVFLVTEGSLLLELHRHVAYKFCCKPPHFWMNGPLSHAPESVAAGISIGFFESP
ncbi:hypothetical protein EMCRGX_G019815 [Ephydatia muelleri]